MDGNLAKLLIAIATLKKENEDLKKKLIKRGVLNETEENKSGIDISNPTNNN